jgi:hypothetical protein
MKWVRPATDHPSLKQVSRDIQARTAQLIAALYAWACARLYAELAWSYDWVAALVSGGRWPHWRRMALDYLSAQVTLELGSGPGHLLVEGALAGREMIGLDASPVMVDMALRRIRAARPATAWQAVPLCILGRGETVPLSSGSVDQVVATFPAPYILAAETLAECRRVLREPDGRLVVVGLWVFADIPVLRSLPVFYGRPPHALLNTIVARCAQAGLAATFHERDDGPFRVGVLIARPVYSMGS